MTLQRVSGQPYEPAPRGGPPFKPYLGPMLAAADLKDYAAAGILTYRVSDSGSIDVLLGRQMARGKGHSRRGTWSFIGGKREPTETCSMATAAREAHEESMGTLTANWVEGALRTEPAVLWQPIGGMALHLAEVKLEEGCAVADALATLPPGTPLPLRRQPPPSTADGAASLSAVQAILDNVGGGPMLLSRLTALLYEQLPASREEVKAAGGAAAWCARQGIHTAAGRKGTVGQETAWLGRGDTLEVDGLLWLPWILLATRADYHDAIHLAQLSLRVHPFFAQILGSSRSGPLLREYFARIAAERRR